MSNHGPRSTPLAPSASDLAATVRKGFNGIRTVRDLALAKDALDALLARCQEAERRAERAEQELLFTHDRGDHIVYRHEWEEFDRWQRWADDQRRDAEKYQPTAQEFNDAMEGR